MKAKYDFLLRFAARQFILGVLVASRALRQHAYSAFVVVLASVYCLALSVWLSDVFLVRLIPKAILGTFVSVFVVYGVVSAVYYYFLMIFFLKPRSPTIFLLQRFKDFLSDKRRFWHFVVVAFLFSSFATFFALNKAMIFKVGGFSWDSFFLSLDEYIFQGSLPHEYFFWVFERPIIAFLIEVVYQAWFYLYYMSIVLVGYYLAFTRVSQVYLLATVFAWFFGGNVVALIFGSAGPVFIEIHQLFEYQDHVEKISEALPYFGSFALLVKSRLLDAHLNYGYSSISAFPSMHVASTLLMVFLAKSLGRKAYCSMLVFFGLVFLGSFVLLWHYFVDAVAGVVVASGSWWLASMLCRSDARLQSLAR